jgi:regulator of nucleoside diphosphate kinase
MLMKPIYLTDQDRYRLNDLIDDCRVNPNGHASCIDSLEREVKRAHTVERNTVGSDVVTMNSRIRLRDMDSGENEVYTLVYPLMADAEDHRISVLAPIGTAIVGSRVGDLIEWPVPAGLRRLLVEKILYQPEEAGDPDL